MAVTPNGRCAYVTNVLGNTISLYDIDPLSGALSPKTPPTLALSVESYGIMVSPVRSGPKR